MSSASRLPTTLPDKVYFRIGEVAELLGVEPHVVRFWQEQFPTVRPERSATGRFLYARPTVERLQRIRALLYDEGYTIAGAKKALQVPAAKPVAPQAAPPPAESPKRVAELEAQVDRLQREARGLEARLEAATLAAQAAERRAEGPLARARAEVQAALAEADAVIAALEHDPR